MMARGVDHKQIEGFCVAIANGAKMFAAPTTTQRMNAELKNAGLKLRCQESKFPVDEGMLYAIDDGFTLEGLQVQSELMETFVRNWIY